MIENGVKWARAGLIGGVIASVAGNVANACLTQTSVSVLLRIPMAVVWPAFLFVAVEVLVRNRAARGWLARIGQGALLTITVPTAITSFVNLHALMIKAAEPGIAQLTGPVAIDGLMLGCTIMMLAARVDIVATSTPSLMDKAGAVVDTLATGRHYSADTPVAIEDVPVAAPIVPSSVADEARSWLDTLEMSVLDNTTTPAAPVSPAPFGGSNAVKASSVPDTALDMFRTWASLPVDERIKATEMYEFVGGAHGRDTRTARRWFASVRESLQTPHTSL